MNKINKPFELFRETKHKQLLPSTKLKVNEHRINSRKRQMIFRGYEEVKKQ